MPFEIGDFQSLAVDEHSRFPAVGFARQLSGDGPKLVVVYNGHTQKRGLYG